MRIANALIVIVLAGLAVQAQDQRRKVIAPPEVDLGLPYSPGILSGETLYLSGAVGSLPSGGMAEGFEAQTEQTFQNLGKVLAAAELGFADVVSVSVYLTDIRQFETFNRIYGSRFKDPLPVRATVETDLAVPNALIEISMVAVRNGSTAKRIQPQGWPKSASDFAWGVQVGDTLYISGMVSYDAASRRIVSGDVALQTRKTLENVGAVLKAAGMDFGDVVNSRVFLADPREFREFNQAYRSFFSQDPPTRATVRARMAHPDLKVEIQCVAVKDSDRKIIAASGVRRSTSPLSPSVSAGGRHFLSGMVGRRPQGGYDRGDVEAQTRQTLDSLRRTLQANGLDFDDVVETVVYLPDVRHFSIMNRIYREMVSGSPPARTTIGTQLMSPDALVEIMMTAVEK